ncbi:MAG: NUDIX hydrolase [Clostridia bacterium]|nr:NUDIX hydrolase [Clostridia bacterium]
MSEIYDNAAADAALREEPLRSELIYDGKIVHLYRDDVRLPNGEEALREVIRHVGAVCVVPLTDAGEVVCVCQYRYPHAKVLLEIPAGKLDFKEEDRPSAALRELREETGAVAGKLTPLGHLYTTPAFVQEVIDMYLAEELTFGERDLDEDEFLDVVRIPLDQLVDDILAGLVPDAKTQAAVLKVWAMKKKEEGDRC